MINLKKIKEISDRQGRELPRLVVENTKALAAAMNLIRGCKGTIVVVGFGKSGAVGSKLAATFRSAGRRAFLLNPVEAFHGEAASVTADDVAIVISSSGESDEIMRIIPWLKKKGVKIISLNPSLRSSLSRASDVVLRTAAPLDSTDNYASYSTCLSALAIGDLMGLALLYEQDMEHERAGSIEAGRSEAIYTIEDMLATRPNNPVVNHDIVFRDALIEMTSKGLGAISIVGEDGKLCGIITDGDVRRLLQKSQGSLTRQFLTNVESVMTRNPKRIVAGKTLHDALSIMEDNAITVLPVVNDESVPVGMIHLHDLVQLGLPYSPGKKAAKKTVLSKKKKKTENRKSKK